MDYTKVISGIGYKFDEDSKTWTVLGRGDKHELKEIEIKSTIDGHYVVRICKSAFKGANLTNVVIPDSITYIDEWAFHDNHLREVVIPNSVVSIGAHAFQNNRITSLILGNSIVNIYPYAFNKNLIEEIDLQDSIKVIGECCFMENKMSFVTIPDTVEYIGGHAFADNRGGSDIFMIYANPKPDWNKCWFENCNNMHWFTRNGEPPTSPMFKTLVTNDQTIYEKVLATTIAERERIYTAPWIIPDTSKNLYTVKDMASLVWDINDNREEFEKIIGEFTEMFTECEMNGGEFVEDTARININSKRYYILNMLDDRKCDPVKIKALLDSFIRDPGSYIHKYLITRHIYWDNEFSSCPTVEVDDDGNTLYNYHDMGYVRKSMDGWEQMKFTPLMEKTRLDIFSIFLWLIGVILRKNLRFIPVLNSDVDISDVGIK